MGETRIDFCSLQFGKHDCHVYNPNHPTFSVYDTRDIQWIKTLFILLKQ